MFVKGQCLNATRKFHAVKGWDVSQVFCAAWEALPPAQRPALQKVLRHWEGVFPPHVLHMVAEQAQIPQLFSQPYPPAPGVYSAQAATVNVVPPVPIYPYQQPPQQLPPIQHFGVGANAPFALPPTEPPNGNVYAEAWANPHPVNNRAQPFTAVSMPLDGTVSLHNKDVARCVCWNMLLTCTLFNIVCLCTCS